VLQTAIPSAFLLWASHFPLAVGPLAWLALVPLLSLARLPLTAGRTAAVTAIGGMLFFLPAMQWMRVADPMMYLTWLGMSLYCSAYFILAMLVIRFISRQTTLPLALTVPIVWIPFEYLRAHFLSGFAWYFLGHSQHDLLPVAQVADIAGVYGVSFLVAASNGMLADWYVRLRWHRPTRALAGSTIATLLLVAAGSCYGLWRMSSATFEDGPRVALLQSNLDQRIRNARNSKSGADVAAKTMLEHCYKLYATEHPKMRPDLIVWPETSYPIDWVDIDPDLPESKIDDGARLVHAKCRELVGELAKWSGSNILLGMNRTRFLADGTSARFNSAIMVNHQGVFIDSYDKIHCVPFGEYLPMRKTFPWMKVVTPYDHDYSITEGSRLTLFPLDATKGRYYFGSIICYEDSDTILARHYAAQVDFLVNISNDGWFNGTSEHEEHLAICRFRAIEARRSVIRSVNMGISAIIDSNGRLSAMPGPTWKSSKQVAAVVSGVVPIDRRRSIYAQWGNWLPWICIMGAMGMLVIASRNQRTMRVNAANLVDAAAITH
jgi:apolipoprotein N-acyltransferase